MHNNFFYRLGHCKDLSTSEYRFLSGDKDYKLAGDFLLGNTDLNVNSTGSLVFGGKILFSLPKNEDGGLNVINLKTKLKASLEEIKKDEKKLGIAVFTRFKDLCFESVKKTGFKKINLLPNPQKLNFGHSKKTKKWIYSFDYKDEVVFGLITSFSNQEFWTDLDTNLPHGDMSRGIINLKLGRSLLNLTNKKKIWDPLAGQGRILVSGLDLKTEFWASDIDEICIPDIKENFSFGVNYWNEKGRHLKLENQNLASLVSAFDGDVTQKETLKKLGKTIQDENLAIVTEGYLGQNFKSRPSLDEIKNEIKKVSEMWIKSFYLIQEKTKIEEVVFCLPFYRYKRELIIWNEVESQLLNLGFELTDFNSGQKMIFYSRKDSFVGHLILKAVRLK
jgi:tRNA G10  N-methylase Trm11